jgi:membrane fusion protein, multidrug efflux system
MNSRKQEQQMKTNSNPIERSGRRGDRAVQIALFVLIAAGIFLIVQTLGSGGGTNPGGGAADASSALGAGGTPGSPTSSDSPAAIAVETYTVTPRVVREYIKVNGEINAGRTVTMYPDAAGEITERNVRVGQYVRDDQQLVVVDPSQPGQRFSTSPVFSTIAGTVTAVHVEIGDTVTQQTAVATVGDLTDLEIVAYIPERFVAAIRSDLVAEMTLEAFPGELFRARVTEVSPVVDATSRTVEVSLAFAQSDPRVKAGMFATMHLITREEQGVLAVPPGAVTKYYDEDVVYVVTAEGAVERRPVTVGLSSSDLVQLVSGVAEGEAVVTAGISSVSDGVAVRVVETGGDV